MDELLYGRQLTKHELTQELKNQNSSHLLVKLLDKAQKTAGINSEQGVFTCERCGTQKDFYSISEQIIYCTNCLSMGRITNIDYLYSLPRQTFPTTQTTLLTWEGTLSPEQQRASKDLLVNLTDSRPHLLHAVTGSGKTEMIFQVIEKVLQQGGRVAVASPRIDVCRELQPRLQAAFESIPIHLMYGGSTEDYYYAQLIVTTTHQLLRFKEAFDLLIVDEVDAFPYVDNEALHYAVKKATHPKGKRVYLTATPDEKLQQQIAQQLIITTTLPARYHGHALPEPKFQWIGNWQKQIKKSSIFSPLLWQLQRFLSLKGVKLLFIPNIQLAEKLYDRLIAISPKLLIEYVHSKDPHRKEKVQKLRKGQIKALISTTILERGVTFTNCHVYIIGAESSLFTSSSLVQMSGRVGRRLDYPTGELVYGHEGISQNMLAARLEITQMNRLAKQRGLLR